MDKSWLRWVTLFTTSSTLLCCALPILLVSLGLGSVVVSMNYNIPGMFWLAQHKYWTLTLSAIMLGFLAWLIWRPNQSCPSDPEMAKYCETSKKWNKRIFWLSVVIWSTGVFFSLVLLPLRNLLGVKLMKKLIFITSILFSSIVLSRTVEIDVFGMTCDFCVDSLNKQFNKLDTISKVDVSLENNKIKLETNATEPSIETIKQAILDAGFTPVSVRITE